MNHKAIQEKLSPYIDGLLTDKERALIEAHLSSCPECRNFHKDLVRLREGLIKLPKIKAPDHFELRLRRALRDEIERDKEQNIIGSQENYEKGFKARVIKFSRGLGYKKVSVLVAVFMIGFISLYSFGNLTGHKGDQGGTVTSEDYAPSAAKQLNLEIERNMTDEKNYYIDKINEEFSVKYEIIEESRDEDGLWTFVLRAREEAKDEIIVEGRDNQIWIKE